MRKRVIVMEIRKVVNEVENEYPKMKQISKKCLKKNIPNKWLKVGVVFLGTLNAIKNKVLAVAIPSIEVETVDLAGGWGVPLPIIVYEEFGGIIRAISGLLSIIIGLDILMTKMKYRKNDEKIKVKKWKKVLFIISTILFILNYLVGLLIGNAYC